MLMTPAECDQEFRDQVQAAAEERRLIERQAAYDRSERLREYHTDQEALAEYIERKADNRE